MPAKWFLVLYSRKMLSKNVTDVIMVDFNKKARLNQIKFCYIGLEIVSMRNLAAQRFILTVYLKITAVV